LIYFGETFVILPAAGMAFVLCGLKREQEIKKQEARPCIIQSFLCENFVFFVAFCGLREK